jgi:serine/threonine-protein kinase HipA
MKVNRFCLCCQKPLVEEDRYHSKCLKELFGRPRVPVIPFGLADMPGQVIKTGARMSVSGVQMKLSVRVNPESWRLETVAEGGTHILKPEPPQYPELQQNENLCMNMATAAGLPVPPHGLFALADGNFCYLIRRFDRLPGGRKLPKETMFQIFGSEDKYRGSLEQVGKTIRAYVANVGLDAIDFLERVLFCFLTGNGDMHLKNWALLTPREGRVSLAPCYDFVSSKCYLPDEADSALTLNGKHDKLSREDFAALAAFLKIDAKPTANVFRKFSEAKSTLLQMCAASELSISMQEKLTNVIESRHKRLFG